MATTPTSSSMTLIVGAGIVGEADERVRFPPLLPMTQRQPTSVSRNTDANPPARGGIMVPPRGPPLSS